MHSFALVIPLACSFQFRVDSIIYSTRILITADAHLSRTVPCCRLLALQVAHAAFLILIDRLLKQLPRALALTLALVHALATPRLLRRCTKQLMPSNAQCTHLIKCEWHDIYPCPETTCLTLSLSSLLSHSLSSSSCSISVLIIAKIRLTANAKLLLLGLLLQHSAICLDNFICRQDVLPKRNCWTAKATKERRREREREREGRRDV